MPPLKEMPKFTRREVLGAALVGLLGGALGDELFNRINTANLQHAELPGGIWRSWTMSVSKGLQVEVDAYHVDYTAVAKVVVNYKKPDGSWSAPVELAQKVSDTFAGTFPISDLQPGQQIEMSFNVWDSRGNVVEAPNGTKIVTVQP